MKILVILGLSAVMAAAQGDQPKAPINNAALGQLEGILAYCAKIDTQSAARYQERSKLLTEGQPDKAVDEARKSKDYQDAKDQIDAQLGQAAASNEAAKSCKAFLDGK